MQMIVVCLAGLEWCLLRSQFLKQKTISGKNESRMEGDISENCEKRSDGTFVPETCMMTIIGGVDSFTPILNIHTYNIEEAFFVCLKLFISTYVPGQNFFEKSCACTNTGIFSNPVTDLPKRHLHTYGMNKDLFAYICFKLSKCLI